ncbi:sigma-70 family rna polymerase sigma factor : RNA polymerase sigma factor, sigma-70 family OS=Singulisphaera acidiphila (strain ATCC BAA-1392 / DSM 18658 / VKM B-2454 / MOB10) GN=Sinac_6419 PE=4 SV=1: Sigma70_r2: Sigma70_r4_2 [Gemmata massiliana]|uniref:ECF RNA polymerase sigma factor SigE n=1 Tax=Gemmata massiliana TaxID=1210884 RepID=A0A6P2D522_9BACT|nr:sigma-70 family RNA polymerase sigma factor [Gemmata massiliana]VTR95545.1 sigma-70 family rna polymerase sigma factor : RNA polymerase sigma factor, sigma-70 family OS=Singulisphaera acidiphila (strain ATCC BAA-1392 / DSM 18658 / VKM B-2454 / MOB10) GN=Sinac_6419 PE=4 SV=1: Sigma70_r2: Sigma70_r4_2 [Gemmata massiliana]
MNATRPAEILRQLEQSGATDVELLTHFASTKDAVAFETLVRRHGALVLGVCRRVTRNPHDAEDAFQATFLVLAQKAGALRNAALLGNWLYGVVFRIACRARRSVGRRRAREVTMANLPEYPVPDSGRVMPELAPILDEELAALAGCYREAIVLCDLRGASREEAAAALGVPEGTLSSRLANGRKKLAVRLAKRGIVLSVALLPSVVFELQAATILPNELLTKTCGLIADYSAIGAVPSPLAKLTQGGFTVRKTFVFGLVLTVAVTGAVFAATPRENALPPDPPKVPAVVELPAEQPKPKEEAKTVEKATTFATTPKLRHSFDLSVGWGQPWFGTRPARTSRSLGWNTVELGAVRGTVRLFGCSGPQAILNQLPVILTRGAHLVAVAPNGKGIITDLREYKLISGHHHLAYWSEGNNQPPGGGGEGGSGPASLVKPMLVISKTVKLDSTETRGYTFAAEGKTFRTRAWEDAATSGPENLEVLEVDATNGKIIKSLMKVKYGESTLSPDGKRLAVLDNEMTKVTVYDVDRGEKLSESTLPTDSTVELPGGKTVDIPIHPEPQLLKFSPDGRRLVVSRGIGRSRVLNTDTGATLPRLEGTALAEVHFDSHAFSGDGRLLAAMRRVYKISVKNPGPKAGRGAVEPMSLSGNDWILTVWDTQTGKVLKSWKSSSGVRWAFCPAKPLLAVLEENGVGNTRVGFWDFAAEVEKK